MGVFLSAIQDLAVQWIHRLTADCVMATAGVRNATTPLGEQFTLLILAPAQPAFKTPAVGNAAAVTKTRATPSAETPLGKLSTSLFRASRVREIQVSCAATAAILLKPRPSATPPRGGAPIASGNVGSLEALNALLATPIRVLPDATAPTGDSSTIFIHAQPVQAAVSVTAGRSIPSAIAPTGGRFIIL